MSFAGLKKQFNKANQYVSEKIGGAKGTSLDEEFTEMERKIDVTGKLVEEIIYRTHEYLQPNPASRAKLTTMNTLHKLQGKAKSSMYPQPEGNLGECMCKYGRELGSESHFGMSLTESGEAFRQMAEIKYTLEDNVKQGFIEPLHGLQNRELKEINHHRKKLEGRRLDFDCKKRRQEKGSKIGEEDIRNAEEKFEESRQTAETAMHNFLSSDVEHIQALSEFIASALDYHRQSVDILEQLNTVLKKKHQHLSTNRVSYRQRRSQNRRDEAASAPRTELPRRSGSSRDISRGADSSADPWLSTSNTADNGTYGSELFPGNDAFSTPAANSSPSPKFSMKAANPKKQTATARALYDFEPENNSELGFNEGDMIRLIEKIDDNWYEGELRGKQGYFPVSYVEVVVPLK